MVITRVLQVDFPINQPSDMVNWILIMAVDYELLTTIGCYITSRIIGHY